MIPDEVVEQVSAAADIVAIIGEHVKLKKTGSVWRGPCPFHQGTNANFSVLPRGGYTCFVCGEKGSVFTFVQKRLGMSFVEAVKYVGAKSGIEVPDVQRKREGPDPREPLWELHGTVAEFFQRQLWDEPAGEQARAYLKERDVSRNTAERFGLGYAPRDLNALRTHLAGLGVPEERTIAAGLLVQREEGNELRPRFRDRLMFPILEQGGKTVGFGGRLLGPGEPKYLNSAESDIFTKGKTLYNLGNARNAIRREDRVILVEGYFDALRLVESGVEHVVAPMGTALAEGQADLLARFTKHAVLLYDSDGPGQKATFRAADVLLAKGFEVRVVTLPEGEDPDTFVRAKGLAGIAPLIENAMDVFDRKVQLLQRAGWFNDLQHKRRALDRLLPTIRAASDPITRDLYLARAADAAGVLPETLLREVHAKQRNVGPAARSAAGNSEGLDSPEARGTQTVDAVDKLRRIGGTYVSEIELGGAEKNLVHAMISHPAVPDFAVEAIGKIEAEEAPANPSVSYDEDGWRETDSVLLDPVFAGLFQLIVRHSGTLSADVIEQSLTPLQIYVLEKLLSEPIPPETAQSVAEGAIAQLRRRSIDRRIRDVDRMLPLGNPDQMNHGLLEKQSLSQLLRASSTASWKSTRRKS